MDRRSFSDPQVRRLLLQNFVTAAGDCKEWQHGHSAAHNWFARLVRSINDPELKEQLKQHGDEGDTAQGLYVAGPDGTPYGWYNGWRHTPEIMQFLQSSLARFHESPPKVADVPVNISASSTRLAPAASTAVVRVFSRIRPLPTGADAINASVGRDHLWLLADEARAILEQSNPKAAELPPPLIARICRYYLIDNVRGEPDAWEANEVIARDWRATLISQTGTVSTYNFSGSFKMTASCANRGYAGKISGQFNIDRSEHKFTRFRAIASGYAWGASRFTPNPPEGKFPLVIGMLDVNDAVSHAVPPEFIGEDWKEGYLQAELSTGSN